MAKAAELIRAHQLISFFTIAIGLMFVLLFPAIYLIPTDSDFGQIAQMYSARLAVFSPVLAGMFVTRIADATGSAGSRKKRWISFTAVWMIATAVRSIEFKGLRAIPIGWGSMLVVGGLEALIPAFVFSSAYSRAASTRKYLRTLVQPTGSWIWYAFALLTFPLIHLLGVAITALVGTAPPMDTTASLGSLSFAFVITFFSVFFYSGGINEESGWRGFAQKRLQAHHSPLAANLILWLLLLAWHIPNDVIQYAQGGYLLVRVLLYPFITILLGFVYNRTGGSILAPAILHSSMNAMNPLMGVLPITTAGNILLVGMVFGFLILDKMWKKLPGDHPAVRGCEPAADSP